MNFPERIGIKIPYITQNLPSEPAHCLMLTQSESRHSGRHPFAGAASGREKRTLAAGSPSSAHGPGHRGHSPDEEDHDRRDGRRNAVGRDPGKVHGRRNEVGHTPSHGEVRLHLHLGTSYRRPA